MSDQQIACAECGDVFVFTVAEQAFYAEKQLAVPPKRCKACRAARKSARDAGGGGARPGGGGGNRGFSGGGNDRGGGRGGGDWRGPPRGPGGGGAGPGGGGNRDRNARPSGGGYRAAGGAVGRIASRPNDGGGYRPNDGGAGGYRSPSFSNEAHGRPQRGGFAPAPATAPAPPAERQARARPERPKFDITCAECGTQASVPFKPLEGRQVFCQPCYRARRGSMEHATEGVEVGETDTGIVE